MSTAVDSECTRGDATVLRVWAKIKEAGYYTPAVLQTMGGVGLAFSPSQPWLFWPGVALTAVGLYIGLKLAPRVSKLIGEHQSSIAAARERGVALQEVLRSNLEALMEDLHVDMSKVRVSVYRHNDNCFILLARFSHSMTLNEPGRKSYPDSEGIIGLAWDKGKAVVVDLPEDRAEWEADCREKWGMTQESLEKIKMRSRCLVGQRIERVQDRAPMGVLIIEGLDARGVRGATLDALPGASNYRVLQSALQAVLENLDDQDAQDYRNQRAF